MNVSTARWAFYRTYLGLALLLALAVFFVFDLTALDRSISDRLYDPVSGFVLEHNRLFENITHRWARILPDWTGEFALIGALLSFAWPRLKAHSNQWPVRVSGTLQWFFLHRRDFLFIVVAFALSTGLIHYLKSHTSVYCPVETTLYGGAELHRAWFDNFRWFAEAGAGRCWPGGHASSAFSLFALYFVARRHRWQRANTVLVIVMVLGWVYGTTRVLQGWHYVSHTLWSGIFVWLGTLLVALLFYGRPALQAPARPASTQAEPLTGVISPLP
ncbi:phosphatidic acid phosphatase [Pseudomonas sp. Leaf127]|uniref:phosphatase PAP2 family protein n=1 Tax=Pseudomonas sp. Leaf127 TaxID=1736267 RepID=UPI0007030D68|nr:phosphatase PAP2 family protein [Pseudomonas sp. Leaf127]KQQ60294.1 phosphatidic acid phosphatase [Pseudomonas sp. Leaf127]